VELFYLDGQVAIITGGGSGIGKVMAETLSEAGAKVVLLGRTYEKVQRAADEISEKIQNEAVAFACDVTVKEQLDQVVSEVYNQFKRIDILVNNAGTSIRKNIDELTETEWDRVMDINLKSIFLASQAVAEVMKKQKYGRIINTTSVAGAVSLFFSTVYGVSKAGAIHLTKQLALELAPYNITVNAISPWFFKTDLNRQTLENEDFLKMIEARTPMKRIGNLEELKTSVLFFAARGSSYVTGQNLFVDGGMTTFGL
jgi:gluconate 5-dehydrogenase